MTQKMMIVRTGMLNNNYNSDTSILLVCKLRSTCVDIFIQKYNRIILNNSHLCKR